MDQKDQAISSLRAEIYEMKRGEKEQRLLDLQISELCTHLTLLQGRKEQAEKEHRLRLGQDNQTVVNLRRELDSVRAQIERTVLLGQDRANSLLRLKKMAESRASEIQLIKSECFGVESSNRTFFEENKVLAQTIKSLKEERCDIESDIEALDEMLVRNAGLIRQREKEQREKDGEIAKLSKAIQNLHLQYQGKIGLVRQKGQEKAALAADLCAKQNAAAQLREEIERAEKEVQHWGQESIRHERLYREQLAQSRELMQRKEFLEGVLRERELALEQLKERQSEEQEAYRRMREENETLGGALERNVELILELTEVNQRLQREVQLYTEENESARAVLSRREKMKEVLGRNRQELRAGQASMQHLVEA